MPTPIEEIVTVLNRAYPNRISSVEQFLFGMASSWAVMTTKEQHKPFVVIEWNNVERNPGMKLYFRRRFDSRTEANKFAVSQWMEQF